MSERTVSTTARDAVHNFSHYAALVDAGTEVIITRRGRASLKLVRAEPAQRGSDHALLIERAMAVRSSKPFKGKFVRAQAYEDQIRWTPTFWSTQSARLRATVR